MSRFLVLASLVIIMALAAACAPAAPTVAPTAPAKAATAAPAATTPAAGPAAASPAATVAGATAKPAATAPTAAPAAKVKRGGTLNYANQGETNTWDPHLHATGTMMHELPVFETPLRWDLVDEKTGKHELHGELAESWELPNPTTIVMKFRKGVKFHDGSDLTAEVVKWNVDRVKTHPKSTGKTFSAAIKSVEVVDAQTLRYNLTNPSAIVLINLTRAAGGGGSAWASVASKKAFDTLGEDGFGLKPVGTGSYMVTEWKRDDRLTMKKFDSYYRKGADGQALPYMDGIVARVITDASVILMEMRAGSVDMSPSVLPQDWATAKSNPDMKVALMPWAAWRHVITFNQHKGPFADNLKLRQAAQYALDRENIAKVLGFGEGAPNDFVYWGPGFPGYDESLPHYTFDLNKAKQLVAEGGYASGVEVGLSSYITVEYKKEAEMIQAMWGAANLRTTLDLGESVAMRAKMKSGDVVSALGGFSPSPDPFYFGRGFLCDGTNNWTSYCNQEVDKCMAEASSAYDFNQRSDIYKRCQRLMYEDAFNAGAFTRPAAMVYRKPVQGMLIQGYLPDLQEVWIDK